MKILWLSHLIPYPPKGGVLMRSYNLIREVARYHEVDLLAFNQKNLIVSYFDSIQIGESKSRESLSKFISEISYFNIPSDSSTVAKYLLSVKSLFTEEPYTINWLKCDDYRSAVLDRLRSESYAIIHFDTISLSPFLDQNIRIPCVLDHHNVESHMMLRRVKHERNPLKKIYFFQEGKRLERYEQKKLSTFDHHIVCSQDDEQRLLSLDKSLSTSVIPNGISPSSSFPPRNPVKPARLLFVGGLNWYPNRDAIHYFLDEVWPLVKEHGRGVCMDIIGRLPSRKIRRYAESDSQIKVHGFVDDISVFYEGASVYICPIRDGGGTKLKILDAMAHRLPLVADRVACEGLNIIDGVHALLSQAPQEMAENILFLLRNQRSASQLQENGYRLVVDNYDFSLIGKKLSDLYISIVDCSRGIGAEA